VKTRSNQSVAIIDDDPIYQFAAKRFLQLSGLAGDIKQFMSADSALEFFEANRNIKNELPDIILLDINMPVTDGWMFLDSFKQLKGTLSKEIQIHMVTSSIDSRDIARSKTYSDVKSFVSKPMEMEVIKEILSA